MSAGDGDGDGEKGGPSFADIMDGARPLPTNRDRVPPARPTRKTPRRTDAGRSAAAFRFPDPDQPRRAAANGVNDTTLRALAQGDPAPEERIELHGVRAEHAQTLLGKRLESARTRGLHCVVVVHGRGAHSPSGEGVLRDALPGWLSGHRLGRHVLAFTPAPRAHGGDGATLVLLRRAD